VCHQLSFPAKDNQLGGEERGYDGGKKITGRKRHILVDRLGLPRLETIFGDNKYRNHAQNVAVKGADFSKSPAPHHPVAVAG